MISRLVVLACLSFVATGCSQSVIVRTDVPAHVTLDGEDIGLVDRDGVEAEVSLGLFPVPYTVEKDGVRAEGELQRTRPSWLPNTAGLCGPFLTAPLCVCVGVSCANPQIFASPLFCVLASLGNVDLVFGACYGLCAQLSLTPGWLTVPLGCGGLTVGMVPLFMLGFGGLEDEIVLAVPDVARAAPPGGPASTGDAAPYDVTWSATDDEKADVPTVAPDEEMRW